MDDISKLEQQADESSDRIAEWEQYAIALICSELGKMGRMTPEEAKKLNKEKRARKLEKAIYKALGVAIALNIKDLPKLFSKAFNDIHSKSEYMYKYRGLPFENIANDKKTKKTIFK